MEYDHLDIRNSGGKHPQHGGGGRLHNIHSVALAKKQNLFSYRKSSVNG